MRISIGNFKGLSNETLELLIKDAQSRINSNPGDRNYVTKQTEFIRKAREAMK